MKLKIGDKVRCNRGYSFDPAIGEIVGFSDNNLKVKISNGTEQGKFWHYYESELEIIESKELTTNLNNMGLKERFLSGIKGEPQKSFNKAGVTNNDDTLTSEGQEVFLAWLLKENGVEFKKQVVDPILKDMAKENK